MHGRAARLAGPVVRTTRDSRRAATDVHELVEQVPAPAAAANYARIVSQAALLRRLISAAADIMEMGYSAPEDPERVADEAEQRIYDVARREEKDQIATLRELVDHAILDL